MRAFLAVVVGVWGQIRPRRRPSAIASIWVTLALSLLIPVSYIGIGILANSMELAWVGPDGIHVFLFESSTSVATKFGTNLPLLANGAWTLLAVFGLPFILLVMLLSAAWLGCGWLGGIGATGLALLALIGVAYSGSAPVVLYPVWVVALVAAGWWFFRRTRV